MQPLLKGLLSDLHAGFFKPNGFAKKRQRFQRDVDAVMQEVDFQSSQWNSRTDPIRFYVNVSVGFADIPVKDDKPALTGRARIPGLVPGAPPHYDLTPDSYAEIRDSLLKAIPSALAALPQHYEDVRACALRGSHCVIPIPESWRSRA
jgi:hypothetical protein